MDIRDVLARNVRRLRNEQKLTQEELAHRAGLSPRYIGSVERGGVYSRISIVDKLATALGVDPGALLSRQP